MKPKVILAAGLFVSIAAPLLAQALSVPNGTAGIGVSSTSNVGVGTNSPTHTFHVEGSFRGGGRTRLEMSRSVGGSVGDTAAVGIFQNDSIGKNIRIYLKAHNGSVIDVHTYEISEVAYIGATTNWLEVPLNQSSVSYSGSAGYAIDVYRPNINSTGDSLFVRIRVKRPIGAGTVQLVVDFDDDVAFTPLSSTSSTAQAFHGASSPEGGPVDGYLGGLEWAFPVSKGLGWANAGGAGLFVKNSGNVGIGTVNPTRPLSIEGPGEQGVEFSSTGTGSRRFSIFVNPGWAPGSFHIYDATADAARFTISPTGSLGIGAITPLGKLTISGAADHANGDVLITGNAAPTLFLKNTNGNLVTQIMSWDGAGNDSLAGARIGTRTRSSKSAHILFTTDDNIRMMVKDDGNVGIGTTSPSHKLTVNGTIRAKEVIVDTGWADYVFAEDYRLAPLSEVEAHIKEHKHLPGIPSAAQVAEQGVSMGEMQARMMAKIEELTLHMIELKKENTELRREVETLKRSK